MHNPDYYKVGGSLNYKHRSYVVREADRQLLDLLKAGEYCFVLNSRQMGKSSLRVRTGKQLRSEGIKCACIDLTLLGSHVSPKQWYNGIAYQLLASLELTTEFEFKSWWQQHDYLTEVQRLNKLIESVLLVKVSQKITIFIDELDSLINISFKDDFFAFIRACYNQRAENPEYNRLTFCLLGVAAPADLIQDKTRTPFNVGRSVELTGFTFAEAKDALIPGLKEKVENPETVLQQILDWTGGQPFLTQKLCSLIAKHAQNQPLNIQELVEQYIIHNWESQDEPEHLRTIRDRLLSDEKRALRLLGLYQQILTHPIAADESDEQTELRLTGLVVKKNGALLVYNPIYQAVFDRDWLKNQLNYLRPYSEAINHWLKSNRDSSQLLQGQALTEALAWAVDKRLSDDDYQFLAASQTDRDRKLNQILTEANEKAKRMIRRGGIILSVTSVSAIIIALLASMYAGEQIRTAKETIRLEKTGVNALQEFNYNQLAGLISAMQAAGDLKALAKSDRVANYPTTTPLSALLNILTYISEQNQLEGHQQGVKTVTFSFDGKLIASGSNDGTIKLWKSDGTPIKTLTHGGWLYSVRFSPDGKLIASGSNDGTIKLWKTDGTPITTFRHGDAIYTLSFNPTGQILASGGKDGTIKLWKLDGTPIKTLTGHKGSVYTASFSPDGKLVASGSNDGTIKLWKPDGTPIQTLTGHKGSVYAVAWSQDGKTIASGSADTTVKLWKADGKLIATLTGHQSEVNSVSFSPDGNAIASGSADTTVKLWQSDGKLITTLPGHRDSVWSVSFSPDGKILASGSLDKTIKLWNRKDTPITHFTGHKKLVTSVSFSLDGTAIASASWDETIKLWKPDGTLIKIIPNPGDFVTSVSFSPDGKILAAIVNDDTVKLWKRDGTLLATFSEGRGNPAPTSEANPAPTSEVKSLSFSPGGKILAAGSSDGAVKLWTYNGKLIKTLTGHKTAVKSVSFSSDGKILASGSGDGTINLWKTDGTLIKTITQHNSDVTHISFSPDGKMLASGSSDGTVKLWQRDGTLTTTLSGHKTTVTTVNFSPDGQIIASLSSDGTIKLWKSDGTLIHSTAGEEVTSISFSPDGQTLVAGSSNGSLLLWSLNLDNLLAQSCTWLKDYLLNHPGSRIASRQGRVICAAH